MQLRDLPSTDALAHELWNEFELPRPLVVEVCRTAIDAARETVLAGGDADPAEVARTRLADLEAARPTTVINATGVLLHTNLGRAVLPTAAAEAGSDVATAAGNVEIDPRSGRRSRRHDYLGPLLAALTGAEAALAVNNNAGALLLVLASLGPNARVAVSRGELIEIGGSFRLPELMASSGAELVEVGTTNRTRITDFEAVAGEVDAILKVHPSNYRIDGFQEEASADDLVELAHRSGVPFINDVGSGLLDSQTPWLPKGHYAWLDSEPGVKQTVMGGTDLVLFSGDKLFGGPQAGIIVGTTDAVTRASGHPIARAVRLDGSAIASLAAVAEMYLSGQALQIPFWTMAAAPATEIRARALQVIEGLHGATISEGSSLPGAGSVPGETIDTFVIEVRGDAEDVWSTLVQGPERIIATRRDGVVQLDLRSVLPRDDARVRSALERALA